MKKKKLPPKDKQFEKELKQGRPDGEKRFFDLLKKASQPLDNSNPGKK